MSTPRVTFREVSIDVLPGGFSTLLTARERPGVLTLPLSLLRSESNEGADHPSQQGVTQREREAHCKDRTAAPKGLRKSVAGRAFSGAPLRGCLEQRDEEVHHEPPENDQTNAYQQIGNLTHWVRRPLGRRHEGLIESLGRLLDARHACSSECSTPYRRK